MQRPNPGELLRGLRQSLAHNVLPALPKGVAHQQMKAALHLISRLERSWDLAGQHFARDNADITAVLAALLPETGPQSLAEQVAASPAEPTAGYNDPALREAARHNVTLHAVLATLPHGPELAALHQRMVARDAVLVGDAPIQESSET